MIFEKKNILITGGTGSIGTEIVKQVLRQNPRQVRVFSRDELKHEKLRRELNDNRVRFLIGDVRDKERLNMAMEDIDIVFHAAALKHVDLCEYNPFESVKTNVLGTQNAVECVRENNAEKFILISTDKATNPNNVMGATKLLSERITIAANLYKGNRKSIFSCVRFGNVVDSRGAFLSVIKNQLAKDQPITLTNPDMTRFVMTVEQAVKLVLIAAEKARAGEIFILKMPALRIGDLMEVFLDEYCKKYKKDREKVQVKKTGIRAGEKMDEELLSAEESKNAVELDNMYVVNPTIRSHDMEAYEFKGREIKNAVASNKASLMTKEEIRRFVLDNNLT